VFNTILNPSSGLPRKRWTTSAVSAVAHITVMLALVFATMYATGTLPEPRDTMAAFIAAPLPAPPPPPPAVPESAPKPAKTVVSKASSRPLPVIATAPVTAPIEAPTAIAPETGREGGEFAATIEAGFERGLPGGVIGGIAGGFEDAPPPPPAVNIPPVRVGGAVLTPRLIHRVDPEYPEIAQRAQIEGVVILEATVGANGTVQDARVLRSHSVLEQAAVDAVRQWRYEPLLLNGTPTPFILTVTVSFGLTAR
jgi:protein TonB